MSAHDHDTYVDGCFRCELARDEVATPTKDIDEPTDPKDAVVEAARAVVAAHPVSSRSGAGVWIPVLVNLRRALEALDD